MNCPTCKDVKLVISERSGIEIDYCPDCRGVWLDRGELDKIIQGSGRSEDRGRIDARDEYRDSRYDSGGKPYKRKKSFLEELFD